MTSLPTEIDTTAAGADNRIGGWQQRDSRSFAYAKEINRAWGSLEPVLTWCKQELTEDWRWQMIDMSAGNRPGRYIFYFDSERDCCAFVLKWC